MFSAQRKVLEFHRKHQLPEADAPTVIDKEIAQHRLGLITEELREFVEAANADNLVGIADALADLLYVVLGTAVAYGIDIAPVFDEVHRSNMTKTPLDPATKKGGKGAGYQPPRIADLLFIQATKLTQAVRDAETRRANECARCGHARELHCHNNADALGTCIYIDADGPCLCETFVARQRTNVLPFAVR